MFRFVIIEKDCFVARDMQDGLMAAAPGSDVVRLAQPEEAEAVLRGIRQADFARVVVITKLSIQQLDSKGLAALAQETGAELVLRLGEDSVRAIVERGWYSLASPFTWDDLATLIGDLSRRPAVA